MLVLDVVESQVMKKKPFLWLGAFVLVGMTAGAGAGAAYYWLQATNQPPEVAAATTTAVSTTVPSSADPGALIERKLATGEGVRYEGNNRVAITLSEAEVNQLIVDGLAQVPEAQPIMQSAQAVTTTIEGNRIRSGVTINAADLPTENLPPQAQQALSMMTLLGNQSVYVGFEGSPRVDNGRLVLDDSSRIQVGRMNLTLNDVSRLTGLDPAQINDTLNVRLPQTGVMLDGLEVSEGAAILRGVVQ